MAYAPALDLPVANFSSGRSSYAARKDRRTFRCMTAVEIVVIAVAIILAIAILTAAVFVARKIQRDEPGPTIMHRRYSEDCQDIWCRLFRQAVSR